MRENAQLDILSSLDSLISQIRNNDVSENLLWEEERQLSKVIFEEVHAYEKSFEDTAHTVRAELLNVYPIGKERYMNQIAYYRLDQNDKKSLQMLFAIVAHREEERIEFSTPLHYHTHTWKEKQIGEISYHYRDKINEGRAERFVQKNRQFAHRFKRSPQALKFYMVENYQEALRLLGFEYNVKNIGKLRDGYGVLGGEVIFSVMNNEDFSHDLFHYYSGTIHDWSVRNWVTEEGLAYSWGNAYYVKNNGEMAEQKELLEVLRNHLSQNKDVDLLSLFENNFWTDESKIFEDLAPDFKVGRLISSLLCDEVYRMHGMDGVDKLLTLGAKPDHFEPFMLAIDKLIGINRDNFNRKMRELIETYE